MKRILLTLSIAILSLGAYSQSSILEVVSSGGGFWANSSFSVSWTLGEPVIDTWINEDAGIMVTSGFQQGDFIATSVPDNQLITSFDVRMFPNPASQETNIKVKLPALAKVNISVHDVTGRVVMQDAFTPSTLEHTHNMNVSSLKSGIYLVRVNSGTKLSKVLKLIKE
jgi:hypothetical protein